MLAQNIRNRAGDSVRGRDGINRTDPITLLPYVEIEGHRSVPDEYIRKVWREMLQDRSAHVVFQAKEVKSEQEMISYLKDPNNLVVFVFVGEEPAGVAWLNGIRGNYGNGHFCFLSKSWGKYTEQMGREILNYWFSLELNGKPIFDVIIGKIPEWNRKAIAFTKRLGFTELGVIPKIEQGHGVSINYVEREKWAKA
jgi:hypothetical protein